MYRRKRMVLLMSLILALSFGFEAFAGQQTGWISRDGDWYYYSASGVQAKNQWLKAGEDLFWMNEDGVMVTNTWLKQDEQWYYMGASGAAVSGWQEIDGKYYFFSKTTYVMATDVTIDSWYVGSDGAWDPSK